MIRLAELIETFLPELEAQYGAGLLSSHRQYRKYLFGRPPCIVRG